MRLNFMDPLVGILCLIHICVTFGQSPIPTSRLVVTFHNATDVWVGVPKLTGVSVIKIYGRRLVLQFPEAVDVVKDGGRIKSQIGAEYVERIELDSLIIMQQMPVSISVTENISVSVASGPGGGTGARINYEMFGAAQPSTPAWNILDSEKYSIKAEGVWSVTNSTPDIVVAVLDTGMAEVAEGVFLNLGKGYDFISDAYISLDGDGRDPDPVDPGDGSPECGFSSWHGTRVASILAARHDESVSFGLKGIAQNSTVLPVRVLGECRTGYASDVADAIVWAAGGEIIDVGDNPTPAQIISMSFAGLGACPDFLQSAVTQARNMGALLISAAGNDGLNTTDYFPANCRGVLAVAGSTRRGGVAWYSNYGPDIAVAAPGGDEGDSIMMLTVDETEYGNPAVAVDFGMGTSFSVPHVAGVGALALSGWWDTGRLWYALQNTAEMLESQCSGCDVKLVSAAFIMPGPNRVDISNHSRLQRYNSTALLGRFNGSFSVSGQLLVGYGEYIGSTLPSCKAGTVQNSNNYISVAATYTFLCPPPTWLCVLDIFADVSGTTPAKYLMYGVQIGCCTVEGFLDTISQVIGSRNFNNQPEIEYKFSAPIQSFVWTFAGASFPGYLKVGDISGASSTGEVYSTSCPTNQYVTGIYGWYGSYLDQVSGICNYLCRPCDPGKYSIKGTACSACPPQYYCPNSGTINPLDFECPSGSYCPGGTSTPIPCNAGYYCPDGSASPILCNAGYTSLAKAVACKVQCSPATPAGSYFTSSCATSACSAGTYSAVSSATVCTSCVANSYSSAGSSTRNCNVGYYGNVASGCTKCPSGKFAASSGSTACAACAACNARFTSFAGTSSCPTRCSPDSSPGCYFTSSCTIAACPAGAYSAVYAATACTNCEANSYSAAGSSTCDCNEGCYGSLASGCAACSQTRFLYLGPVHAPATMVTTGIQQVDAQPVCPTRFLSMGPIRASAMQDILEAWLAGVPPVLLV